jgi:IclR family pca regulon transcriptional regulator
VTRARTTPSRPAEFIQSLDRGFAVIRAFGDDAPRLTLSDVARRSGIPRATARRFLHTLVELGYAHTDGRMFALRPRILELGYSYLSSLRLPEIAQPHMERLVARVHESSSMTVLDGTEIVYVARVAASRIMRVTISVGTRFPAYATSMGRVLLAAKPDDWLDDYLATEELRPFTQWTVRRAGELRKELDRVREQGWAFVDQELEEGLRSIAAPITARDSPVAALNLSVHASRADWATIERELLPPLLETTAAIGDDLRAAEIPSTELP